MESDSHLDNIISGNAFLAGVSQFMLFEQGKIESREQIPEKLQELTPEELNLLKERYGLSEEMTQKLIMEGLSLLGSTKVSRDTELLPSGGLSLLSEKDLIKETPQKPMALDVGDLGNDDFVIFVKSKKLREFLGKERPGVYPIKLKYENIDDVSVLAGGIILKGLSKLPIPNDNYPRTTPVFSYGLHNPEDKLAGILCFRTNALDKEVKFSSEEFKNFAQIFYRHYSAQDREIFGQFTKEAEEVVASANSLLNLPDKAISPLELILSGRKQFMTRAGSYFGSKDILHRLILVSRWRLEDAGNKKNRARILRHEYLHLVDEALGKGRIAFSALRKKEWVEIVNRYLFDSKLNVENVCQGVGDLFCRFDDDVAYKIKKNFSEHWFLPDCPMAGHAQNNIRELLASSLNNYLDPDFEKGIELKALVEREKIAEMYEEIVGLVGAGIKERY